MYFLIHSLQCYSLLGNNNVMDLNKKSGRALRTLRDVLIKLCVIILTAVS